MGAMKVIYKLLTILFIITFGVSMHFKFNIGIAVSGILAIVCQLSVIETIMSNALKD